jgi:hypothetical protein
MNRRLFGALGAIAVLTLAGGCAEDPLSDFDGNPAAIVKNFNYLQLSQGDSIAVTASVVDGRATPLLEPVTFTACSNDINVVEDTSYHPVPATSARAIVIANTANASCVVVEGGGLEDTIDVAVLSLAFPGTPSTTDIQPGDTLTITTSGLLLFDPDSANIDFGDGFVGEIVTRTQTTLTVVVPFSPAAVAAPTPAPLLVLGIDVTYVPAGLVVDLPTQADFLFTNPWEPNEAPPPTANLTLPDTLYDGFAEDEENNYYQFTLGATTTFTVHLEWEGDADLDILFATATGACCVGNFDGATGANPEASTVTLNAGTYNLWINNFVSGTATPPAVPLYRVRITVP